jgi:hypothetical protein
MKTYFCLHVPSGSLSLPVQVAAYGFLNSAIEGGELLMLAIEGTATLTARSASRRLVDLR